MTRERAVPSLLLVVLVLLLFAVSACAQLGFAPAQSFNQRVAYGYGTVTAVRNAAAKMVKEKVMSAEDGRRVLSVTDSSRGMLDRAASLGDVPEGRSNLQLANELLSEVQRFLEQRQRAGRVK